MSAAEEPLAVCGGCKRAYPEDILSPVVGSSGATVDVCGICALERVNKIHGISRDHFDGERAEEFRLAAVAWRRRRL